ncbi:MAG: YceI family protein [Streptosporangiaceae bacterium]
MTTEARDPRQPGAGVVTLARDGRMAGRWKLDPTASQVEFRVRHFWNAITVRGWFDQVEGEGMLGPDGRITGQLLMVATSLNTKNKRRDKHLRSADFFDADKHPHVVLTVRQAALTADGRLTAEGTLEAGGTAEPVTVTADVVEASAEAVTLRAELAVDRSRFGMTWSPLRMAAMQATGTVTARFIRVPAGNP